MRNPGRLLTITAAVAAIIAIALAGTSGPVLVLAALALALAVVASERPVRGRDTSVRDRRLALVLPCTVLATLAAVYAAGFVSRANPVYGVSTTTHTQWLAVCGLIVASLAGVSVGMRQGPKLARRLRFAGNEAGPAPLRKVGHVALAAALVNYITGVIPLLSENVNAGRFASGGDYGVFGRLWPEIYACLETVVFVQALYMVMRRRLDLHSIFMVTACSVPLILSGSRAFLSLALLSLLFGVLFTVNLRFSAVVLSVVGGVLIAAWFGAARTATVTSQQGPVARQTTLDALSASVSTGPDVWQLARDNIGSHPDGSFPYVLLGDLYSAIPRSHMTTSDRWVTSLIGRDPDTVGGSPPTVIGGLDLDFGPAGVLVGCAVLGASLAIAARWYVRRQSWGSLVVASYWLAYVSVSAYSYISVKPSLLVVLALGAATRSVAIPMEGGRDHVAHTYGVEVREGYRRSRAARA